MSGSEDAPDPTQQRHHHRVYQEPRLQVREGGWRERVRGREGRRDGAGEWEGEREGEREVEGERGSERGIDGAREWEGESGRGRAKDGGGGGGGIGGRGKEGTVNKPLLCPLPPRSTAPCMPQVIHRFTQSLIPSRYVRVLGALYLRLVGTSLEVYNYLEPLYNDYRKLKIMSRGGEFQLSHVDEFVDKLLHEDRACDIILPRIQVYIGKMPVKSTKTLVSQADILTSHCLQDCHKVELVS